ncbi:hypothetical protein H4R24_000066 [Coemansia sp. RSA 988]|nr:hypothetical protein H4R24_000066 [Coemansia sp. RSA 988]
MEASRSTIIKSMLAREGPMLKRHLYNTIMTTFPEQFKGVSYTRFKDVYVRNLKEFQQISERTSNDDNLLVEKLKAKFAAEYPSEAIPKTEWILTIKPSLASRYSTGAIGATTNTKEIIAKVEKERLRSKDFWEGKSNTPHDWRAIVKSFKLNSTD